MTSERTLRGSACEALAALFLEAHGLKVLARNLRCKAGELDLVCRDGDVLAIVEVRQRQREDYGGACASVNAAKQRKIILAARYFLERRTILRAYTLRFDVVAIQGSPESADRIIWLKDAFRLS